jgi:hypothetical protein
MTEAGSEPGEPVSAAPMQKSHIGEGGRGHSSLSGGPFLAYHVAHPTL